MKRKGEERQGEKEEVEELSVIKKQKHENKKEDEKVQTPEIFADPTYDITFKMLFGSDKNKDVLISLLNNLLDFRGEKQIVDVTINSSDLSVEGISDIKGAVDVLCTTRSNQKIAVEMQRKYKDYFLPRSQEYMSKIIAGQVKEGEGQRYDTAVMDTYILAIEKENIFRGKYMLKDKDIFEVTVVPMVVETQEEIPGNKMHWKFFELPKFAKAYKSTDIGKTNSLKEQWLDFLIKCSKQDDIPDNIDDIIKKGYNIMKVANWSEDQRILYWKQRSNEIEELKEQKMLEEKAFQEGIEKGIEKGKLKGEIKGEISKIKGFIKYSISPETFTTDLKFLTHDKVKENFKTNLTYIQDHLSDADSDICDELELVGKLSDFTE